MDKGTQDAIRRNELEAIRLLKESEEHAKDAVKHAIGAENWLIVSLIFMLVSMGSALLMALHQSIK